MNPYSLVLGADVAATMAVFAVVALRMRQRLPRNALLLFLVAFAASHVFTLGLLEGVVGPEWAGPSFGALVLGYAALALFVILFLYGESLRHRMPTVVLVLVPGLGLAATGALAGWQASTAFRAATDPLTVAVNGYLILCLGVGLAESLAVWRRSPGRAREAFPLVAGSIALIVGGPAYAFELAVLGFTDLTGTNLAVPVAGALFAAAMATGNPIRFQGLVPEGPRLVPWMVPPGVYLVAEARPKYAQALFLAGSHESPALAILSEPESSAPDLAAGIETVRLPAGSRSAAVLAATASEFLQRRPSGIVLVNDASYAVQGSGLAATVEALRRTVAGMAGSARLVVSLANLTDEERTAFRVLRGTFVEAPDVEAELRAALTAHLGAASDPLSRAALARGKRVEDLSIPDVPLVRDYLLASLADLRAEADDAVQSGWRQVSEGLATDLEALFRTPPMEERPRRTRREGSPPDIPLVTAAEVLGPTTPAKHAEGERPLGTAVRDAFLRSLGPAGEPVYRRVMGVLRKDAANLGPEDLPRVARLAEEALADLGGVIDVDAAKQDLLDKARRLQAQLNGLARGER